MAIKATLKKENIAYQRLNYTRERKNEKFHLKRTEKLSDTQFKSSFIPFVSFVNVEQQQSKRVSNILKCSGGILFYSNLVAADDWIDYGITKVPYGMYSFNASSSPSFNQEYIHIGLDHHTGVFIVKKV